jgi:hypothetical protein
MNIRTQISMDPAMRRRALAKAAALGISFAEYVRRLVARDLGDTETRGFAEAGTEPKPDISSIFDLGASAKPTDIARDKHKVRADVSVLFDLIDEGPPTNIARDKDKLIGEAVWANYLRKVGRRPRRKRK